MKVLVFGRDGHPDEPQDTEITIPDGKWVIEGVEEQFSKTIPVFSPEAAEPFSQAFIDTMPQTQNLTILGDLGSVRRYRTEFFKTQLVGADGDHRVLSYQYLCVADSAFVVLTSRKGEPSLKIYVSRQIAEGKPDNFPSISMPEIVGGWTRLVDLARLAKITPQEFWRQFYCFDSTSVIESNDGLPVMLASTAQELQASTDAYPLALDELEPFLARYPSVKWSDLWVLEGWALNILFLLNAGYKPEPAAVSTAPPGSSTRLN